MSSTVYIVDDDFAVSKALCLLFKSVQVNAIECSSAEEFLTSYKPSSAEDRACLVTDVRMPGMSGIELLAELRRRDIQIPIIVISGYADVPQVVRAMRAGAVTVLEKPVNEQELIDVVDDALKQPIFATPANFSATVEKYRQLLTDRQREVFDCLLKGLQTKEVARQLGLSPRTVEVHRANILERLEVSNFSQVLRQFLAGSDQH